MKNYTFIVVCTLLGCLSACQKAQFSPSSMQVDINVSAILEDAGDSKTYLGSDNTVLWGEKEQMFLSVLSGTDMIGYAQSAQTSAFDGQAQATFAFSLSVPSSSSYTYAGVYPASVMCEGNVDAKNVRVLLPESQSIPDRGGMIPMPI